MGNKKWGFYLFLTLFQINFVNTQQQNQEVSIESQIEEIFNEIKTENEQKENQNAQENSETKQKITIQLNPNLKEEPVLEEMDVQLDPEQLVFNENPEQLISEEIVINEFEDDIKRAMEWAKEKVVLEDDQLRQLQLQSQINRRNELLQQQQNLINQKLQNQQIQPQSNIPRILVITEQPNNQQISQLQNQQLQQVKIPLQQNFNLAQKYQQNQPQQIIIRQPPVQQLQFQNLQNQQPQLLNFQQQYNSQNSSASTQLINGQTQQSNQTGQNQYQYQFPQQILPQGNFQTVGQFSQSDGNWQSVTNWSNDQIRPEDLNQELNNMVSQLGTQFGNDWVSNN